MNIIINSHEYNLDNISNRSDYIHDIIQELQWSFPRLFPAKPKPKLPLAIGIHKQLAVWADVRGIPMEDIKEALGGWCKGRRYWRALKYGQKLGVRFGVSGFNVVPFDFNERVDV